MQNVINYLKGKKTYIVASVIAIINVLVQYQVIHIPARTIDIVNAVLAALGLAALRAGVAKVGKE